MGTKGKLGVKGDKVRIIFVFDRLVVDCVSSLNRTKKDGSLYMLTINQNIYPIHLSIL
jgi:hypothetical protein